MSRLLCTCPECHFIFKSGLNIENSTNVRIYGVTTVCPRCGSKANVQSGIYDFINGSIRLIREENYSSHHLDSIIGHLKYQVKNEAPVEEVKQNLNTIAPGFSKIVDLLPSSKSEFYTFLGLLVAIFTLVLQTCNKSPEINIQNNQVIEIYNEMYSKSIMRPDSNTLNRKEIRLKQVVKFRRNDPCPCGSGQKYKLCCGKYN